MALRVQVGPREGVCFILGMSQTLTRLRLVYVLIFSRSGWLYTWRPLSDGRTCTVRVIDSPCTGRPSIQPSINPPVCDDRALTIDISYVYRLYTFCTPGARHKVDIQTPLYRDERTPEFLPPSKGLSVGSNGGICPPSSWPMIHMDATAFGGGCCCLQVTVQVRAPSSRVR